MRQLRWAPAAASDLESIDRYLDQHFPAYRTQTIQRLYDATRSLKAHPHKGRVGRKSGTRELVLVPLP
ncbi:type II toxin-antitoxin system RelE/ParE family toxin [Terracidiphilus sp.]|uniref:type II toxin-antitoxin system RelE/ParE family toxin n=1 Tax=Terracidiphilus sp. TaxID=1964191 RepID=UPI003C26521C